METTINVTEAEIARLEEYLFHDDSHFADDAIEVIKCWDSKDVCACPGSGKTTVLLAKLKILADRMPLPNNAGVCVLSHTNVAVNEIKSRLSDSADKLMRYPNYVGTIQSFIDSYVVNPYLKQLTDKPISVVDNDVFAQHLYSLIWADRKYAVLKNFLSMQFSKGHYEDVIEFIRDVRIQKGALYVGKQARAIAGAASPSAKAFENAIQELLTKDGMIRYKDAYSYANDAIDFLSDEYTNLFCKRFPYVFVDEYQDCNLLQRRALDRLFDSSKCCMMHIGDPDQAIYNSEEDGIDDWVPDHGFLPIASSCRYGQEIADILKSLRNPMEKIHSIKGFTNFQPTVIIFDDDSRKNVINTFISVMDDNQLYDCDGIYKVIGMVKNKNLKGLKISDYWADYDDSPNGRGDYRYWSYIDEILQMLLVGDLYVAELTIRKLICKIFHYLGTTDRESGKEFTCRSLKQVLDKRYSDIYRGWLLELSNISFSRDGVDNAVRSLLQKLLRKDSKVIFEKLPEHFLSENGFLSNSKSDSNSFVESLHGRTIQFDTVHGVKGETHDATLYLETVRSRSSDVKSTFTYFGIGKESKNSNYNRKCLYVGMSRPRKLLCLAISEATYLASKDIFANWKKIDCREAK